MWGEVPEIRPKEGSRVFPWTTENSNNRKETKSKGQRVELSRKPS